MWSVWVCSLDPSENISYVGPKQQRSHCLIGNRWDELFVVKVALFSPLEATRLASGMKICFKLFFCYFFPLFLCIIGETPGLNTSSNLLYTTTQIPTHTMYCCCTNICNVEDKCLVAIPKKLAHTAIVECAHVWSATVDFKYLVMVQRAATIGFSNSFQGVGSPQTKQQKWTNSKESSTS